MNRQFFGAIELGGTKSLAVVADDSGNILTNTRISTTDSSSTLLKLANFFQRFQLNKSVGISALGIGAFGPLNLDPDSKQYGYITTTPKHGWEHTNVLNFFSEALSIPVFIDTDVNVAALGEFHAIRHGGISDLVYLTIGTGIGAGIIVNGGLVHGAMHPEFGHVLLRQDISADPFPGVCPYHANCFEGLASGPAIAQRWIADPASLCDDHPAWDLEAKYISQAMEILICILSPQRIILGGGVMNRQHLFPPIHEHSLKLLNGYIQNDTIDNIQKLIVAPTLGNQSGIQGALRLGMRGLSKIT